MAACEPCYALSRVRTRFAAMLAKKTESKVIFTAKIMVLAAGEELAGAPELVKILPMGLVKSAHGNFVVDDQSFAEIKQRFEQRGIDLVIDYEHQTLKNVQAPAGGWIKELLIHDGAIAAKVEWTPAAKKYLENREYRYLSPTVYVRDTDKKAFALHSVALTNTPAIEGMYPIANSDEFDFEGGNKVNELLKKIAELLGLGEDATEDVVVAALEKLKQEAAAQPDPNKDKQVENKVVCSLLGIPAGASTADAAAANMALKAPDNTNAELKALKDKIASREADEAVAGALHGGKISAAQESWAKEYALKDPTGFASFVEKAPQVVPIGELDIEPKALKDIKTDAQVMQVCSLLGIAADDIKQYGEG